MKGNGVVSHAGQSATAARLASANAPHASSSTLRRRLGSPVMTTLGPCPRNRSSSAEPVARMANGLDRRLLAELLAQAANADLDDVRAGIEVVAPYLREKALTADDRPCVLDKMVQHAELAVREVGDELADPRLAPGEVEREGAGVKEVVVVPDRVRAELDAKPRDQLVERERLREIVARAQTEATQLRRQIWGARTDDHGG